MIHRGLGPALVCLAGCNFVFGLDPSVAAEEDFDFDGDGVQNTKDNCPTVANATQDDADSDQVGDACDPCAAGPEAHEDVDDDGVDDACDPCTRGPQHDEDADGLMDACDNCPAQANADQANADGDDLGDACDLDDAISRRILFDGFGTIDSSWRSLDLWQIVNDAAAPVETGVADHGLWDPVRGATGIAWHVELAYTLPVAPAAAVIGVNIYGVGNPRNLISWCALQWSGTDWYFFLPSGVGVVTPFPAGRVVLRMRSRPGATFSHDYTCEIVGGTAATGSTNAPMNALVELRTQSTPIDYIDFIQD